MYLSDDDAEGMSLHIQNLLRQADRLNPWQINFLHGIDEHIFSKRYLSKKQMNIIDGIYQQLEEEHDEREETG